MSYELIGRVRNADAAVSLYEAQQALDARDFKGACTMAAVAAHYAMRGLRITGSPDWDRFHTLTPVVELRFDGTPSSVYTRDVRPTRDDAEFCVRFALKMCLEG